MFTSFDDAEITLNPAFFEGFEHLWWFVKSETTDPLLIVSTKLSGVTSNYLLQADLKNILQSMYATENLEIQSIQHVFNQRGKGWSMNEVSTIRLGYYLFEQDPASKQSAVEYVFTNGERSMTEFHSPISGELLDAEVIFIAR